jgi:hypothetical protein
MRLIISNLQLIKAMPMLSSNMVFFLITEMVSRRTNHLQFIITNLQLIKAMPMLSAFLA